MDLSVNVDAKLYNELERWLEMPRIANTARAPSIPAAVWLCNYNTQ